MTKHFDNNYAATIELADIEHFGVGNVNNMKEYLDYFFGNFPICGWELNGKFLHVWGNRWPVNVVIRELNNITIDVERLS